MSNVLIYRLARGGLPAVFASAIAAGVPVLGAFSLEPREYAFWALCATVITISVIMDFGVTGLTTKLSAEGRLTQASIVRMGLITGIPPLVVGIITVALWPIYNEIAEVTPSDYPAQTIFMLISVGCVLRSVGVIFAYGALGRQHFANRAAILVAGAMVNLIAVAVLLAAGVGAWSLAVGTFLAGAVQFLAGVLLERPDKSKALDDRQLSEVVRFTKIKGLATVLSLSVTQLDRWAIGVVGPPSLLSSYDLMTRILVVPKIVLLALLSGLVGDIARCQSQKECISLGRKANRLNILLSVSLYLIAILSVFTIESKFVDFGFLVVLLGLAHLAHSLTTARVLLVTGLGRPAVELSYLIPMTIVAVVSYVIGLSLKSGYVLITVWSIGMISSSSAFYLFGYRPSKADGSTRGAELAKTIASPRPEVN